MLSFLDLRYISIILPCKKHRWQYYGIGVSCWVFSSIIVPSVFSINCWVFSSIRNTHKHNITMQNKYCSITIMHPISQVVYMIRADPRVSPARQPPRRATTHQIFFTSTHKKNNNNQPFKWVTIPGLSKLENTQQFQLKES